MNIGFGMAFGAGALSFLSPCVLPLIPGYLAMMSGLSLRETSADGATVRRAGLASTGFVLGFAVAFTSLGALASEVTAPLFTYSLGLGLPFIAAGLAASALLSFFTRYRRFILAGKIASGALLIAVGGILWSRAA